MGRNPDRRMPGGLRATLLAALVHIVVGAVLVIGWRWHEAPPAPPGKPIQAVVVDDPKKTAALEEAARQREEEERARKARAEQERLHREAEIKRQAEIEERRRQIQQQLALEKQKAEAERKRQAEIKRKQDEEKKKVEAEQKRLAELKKQEEERQTKAAESALREQMAAEEQERAQAQAAVEQARAQAARSAQLASERDRYKLLIASKVRNSWITPFVGAENLKATVRVRLLPSGDVILVNIVTSSGNAQFDRSVEVAVRRAAPLPVPTDPALFNELRDIAFNFSPK